MATPLESRRYTILIGRECVANAAIVVVACHINSGRSTWIACLWAKLKYRYMTLML
jgi:hypothetical protein